MAYTDVWDVTAPLDTQAANQGAVDFRATKLDVMQRIASFGAGLLAARPTPETTSGTADWTGVMYWATDTSQVFRWSGAAWVDITADFFVGTSSKIFSNGSIINPTSDSAPHVVYTCTIPAGTIGTTGGFKCKVGMVFISGSGNCTVQCNYAADTIFDEIITPGNAVFEFFLVPDGGVSNQQGGVFWNTTGGVVVVGRASAAVDSTVDQPLEIIFTGPNTLAVEFVGCLVEKV